MLVRGAVQRRRRSATMVETTIVLLLVMTVMIAGVIGGVGIMRYQIIATLAREATRAASVRGGQYRVDHGLTETPGDTSTWSADLYSSGMARFSGMSNLVDVSTLGLDTSQLTYACTWYPNNNVATSSPWYGKDDNYATYVDTSGNVHANKMTVTVTYNWFPEALGWASIQLSSTSETQISY